ncbi:MAG: restriction endonuclease, partial [Sphingomonadales bacterium]|nr:restriction endonuclease [Sphingomonadales bacterium]
MTTTAEGVRERAKARRQESYRLGHQMLSFEASPSFAGMGLFVRNENLVLSDRLRAVEAAIQKGVVTEEEIRNPGVPPRPEAFGLISDEKPSRFTQEQKVRFWAIGEKAYPALMAACAVAVGIWLHLTNNPLLICIIMGAIGGLFGFLGILMAGTAIFMALEATAPGAAAWRTFKVAKDRHGVLVAAKRVIAAESDVKAFGRANGPEFERLCARAFRRHGYRVEEMGGANDGGVDLLV